MGKLRKVYLIPKWGTDYHKDFRLREKTKCFKACSKCGETKLIFRFSVEKRNPDGRTGICKECSNREYLKYYYRNRGKILIQSKIYRETHKRYRSVYLKNYQERHKERFKVLARERYLKNREAIIEKSKRYYQEHKEAVAVRKRLWGIKNEERIRKYNREYKLKREIAS